MSPHFREFIVNFWKVDFAPPLIGNLVPKSAQKNQQFGKIQLFTLKIREDRIPSPSPTKPGMRELPDFYRQNWKSRSFWHFSIWALPKWFGQCPKVPKRTENRQKSGFCVKNTGGPGKNSQPPKAWETRTSRFLTSKLKKSTFWALFDLGTAQKCPNTKIHGSRQPEEISKNFELPIKQHDRGQ